MPRRIKVYAILSDYQQDGIYDYPDYSSRSLVDIVGTESEARSSIERIALENFYSDDIACDSEEWIDEGSSITRIQTHYGGSMESTWYYESYEVEAGE